MLRWLRGMGATGWLALALMAGSAGALAQDNTTGMAIAQSPDENFQACHGATPEAALNCARAKCREAHDANCLRVRWCYPAGYAGAMSYLANRELTHVDFLCGAPTEAVLMGMLAARCQADATATECRLMVLWSPDGTETARTDHLGKNTAN